jgi:hypothetical protein
MDDRTRDQILGLHAALTRLETAAGPAPAAVSSRPADIPYAWTDPENGGRHCPECPAVIAGEYDAAGKPLTRRYAGHYLTEHGS